MNIQTFKQTEIFLFDQRFKITRYSSCQAIIIQIDRIINYWAANVYENLYFYQHG